MSAGVLLSVGPVDVIWNDELGRGSFVSCMMIDDDGSGDPHNDPDFQARTSYRNGGAWLNADEVPYIVLPPQVILGVKGVVLGCKALVINGATGQQSFAVVGDVGPHAKIGEGSIALAKAIGVPWSPTTGGEERRIISYAFWPDVPAVINGVTYALQEFVLAA